jgi:hypothetical protein
MSAESDKMEQLAGHKPSWRHRLWICERFTRTRAHGLHEGWPNGF